LSIGLNSFSFFFFFEFSWTMFWPIILGVSLNRTKRRDSVSIVKRMCWFFSVSSNFSFSQVDLQF
jgi:hypothetical protein